MNKPYELTAQEWEEVAGVRAVRESFGLEDEAEPAAWLASYAYGVRFDYENECPGYDGPLYLLKSAGAPEIPPLMFARNAGRLQLLNSSLMDEADEVLPGPTLCTPPTCDGKEVLFGDDGDVGVNPGCPNYLA